MEHGELIVLTIMNYSFNSTVGEWRLSSPECSLLRSSFPILHPSGGIAVKCGNTKYLFSKLYKLSTVFTRPKIRNGTALSPACPRTSATSATLHSGRIQAFLANGCIGCTYLVKILANCAPTVLCNAAMFEQV